MEFLVAEKREYAAGSEHDEEEQVAVGIDERDAQASSPASASFPETRTAARKAVTGSVRRPERERKRGKEIRRNRVFSI